MTWETATSNTTAPLVESSAAFQRKTVLGSQIVTFPGIYTPPVSEPLATLVQQLSAIPHSNIAALLKSHGGALLFRGYGVSTAQDFSDFAHSLRLGPRPHVEVGRPPRRTVLAKGVSTANEGPPTDPVWVHNEYGWSKVYPGYILFFALQPAPNGGETPINSGLEFTARLRAELPDLYDNLKEKGLEYIYRYTWNDNPRSIVGASVIDAYGQEVKSGDSEDVIRQKVEKEIHKHSDDFEWHQDRSLSVWHRVPAIRTHAASGEKVFFGNLISAYERAKFFQAIEPPFLGTDGGYHPIPRYGDGSVINIEQLEQAAEIVRQTQVVLAWQQGDVLVLDNHAVQHARRPWTGERKVLASLWDGVPFSGDL